MSLSPNTIIAKETWNLRTQTSLFKEVTVFKVSNFLRSVGHFFFVRSNSWGPVTSENKCVWAPKPCIMRRFGLKMQQKQVREKYSGKFVKLVFAR